MQKTPDDVAKLFHRVYGSEPSKADPVYLGRVMREHTRPLILQADAGMTGANFAVADTGAIVTATNEGNADLSGNVPKLRICSVGIEKIIPGTDELAVFLRLLTRSATGERITQYTSHFAKPRAGGEMHIVLVDNGRTTRLADERFWSSLKCIRCGACMNTCPVYRRSGGLSYGATYMGPIGMIMMPASDIRRYRELPFASTINGSCSNVCPVHINIHEQIYEWRSVMDDTGQFSTTKKAAMKIAGKLLAHPTAYRAAAEGGALALRVLPHFALYNRLNAWGRHRDLPQAPKETFHQWYARTRGADQQNQTRPCPPATISSTPPAAVQRPPSRVPVQRPADLVDLSTAAVARLYGTVISQPPPGSQQWLWTAFPGAHRVYSAVGEVTGTVDGAEFADWGAPADVDITVVRTPLGVAETGSILLTENEIEVSTAAVLAEHLVVLLDPSDIVENLHLAYRNPAFQDAGYAVLLSGPSGSADTGGVTIHPAQGVTTLTVVLLPSQSSDIAHQ